MKFKFRVVGYEFLKNNKGTLVILESPFGERVSSYVSPSMSPLDLKREYPEQSVLFCDVIAYKNKQGDPTIGVNLPVSFSETELF